jgi:hypothetical protein
MQRITEFIADKTGGMSFKTNKYSLENNSKSIIDYEEAYKVTPSGHGETVRHSEPVDLSTVAKRLQNNPSLFKYFLDGSRRTFRVDDIIYGQKVFPIVAGQIGVGCCCRDNRKLKCQILEMHNVIVLPETADKDGISPENFFGRLKDLLCSIELLKRRKINISKVLFYSETLKDNENYEDKGIAKIQDTMIEKEKYIVAELTKSNLLDDNTYLLKDGSLEYKKMIAGDYKELIKIKNNYRFCIGVSKTFNPEKIKDTRNRSNASLIAKLGLYHRTPAYLYESEITGGVPFAVWYVRVRSSKYTYSPFEGILKLEKILITDNEQRNGLDSELVNYITAHIINERNPTCYGNDSRWANHLYPVFLTECFIKSKYLSNEYFLNLF